MDGRCKNKERFDRSSSGSRKMSENHQVRHYNYRARINRENGDVNNGSNGHRDSSYKRKNSHSRRRFSSRSPGTRSRSRSRASVFSRSSRGPPEIRNDEKGYLITRPGDVISQRYLVQSILGEGTFGRCLQCYDKKSSSLVAIKVIRSIQKYKESAMLEIDVLKTIQKAESIKAALCINFTKYFEYGGHVCIVFPRLGKSVFDFLKSNNYQPYTLSQVRHISYQMVSALQFLHSIKLTHTDLKPENMLFVSSDYELIDKPDKNCKYKNILNTDIRIIDFGSATFDNETKSRVVCTRHYRPPEVILDMGWDKSCDMWGAGCIIAEMFVGDPLFLTHDNHEHLIMMETMLGPFPTHMIKESSKSKYFSHGRVRPNGKHVDMNYIENNCCSLRKFLSKSEQNVDIIYDIVEKLLAYDPSSRMTANEAVNHPLFKDLYCSF